MAEGVLIGRATLYGTAAGGEAGATRALTILREEIDRVMALLGVNSVAELGLDQLCTSEVELQRRGEVVKLAPARSAAA